MAKVDVLLDPDTGDLPEVTSHISGIDLIKQKVIIRLKTFRGEWFLNTRVGVPYFELLEDRTYNIQIFSHIVRKEILKIDGILSARIDADLDREQEEVVLKGIIKIDPSVGGGELVFDSRHFLDDENSHPFITVLWKRTTGQGIP